MVAAALFFFVVKPMMAIRRRNGQATTPPPPMARAPRALPRSTFARAAAQRAPRSSPRAGVSNYSFTNTSTRPECRVARTFDQSFSRRVHQDRLDVHRYEHATKVVFDRGRPARTQRVGVGAFFVRERVAEH